MQPGLLVKHMTLSRRYGLAGIAALLTVVLGSTACSDHNQACVTDASATVDAKANLGGAAGKSASGAGGQGGSGGSASDTSIGGAAGAGPGGAGS